jgi:hypothetical protein
MERAVSSTGDIAQSMPGVWRPVAPGAARAVGSVVDVAIRLIFEG